MSKVFESIKAGLVEAVAHAKGDKVGAVARVVNCPTCGKPVEWRKENRYRPFCSERCRQIDLGAWASGEYSVPGGPESVSGPGGADGGDAMGAFDPS